MVSRNRWAVLILALSAGLAACGDRAADERAALHEEELDRELRLALEGDTTPTTFEDTVVGLTPEPTLPPRTTSTTPPARRPEPAPVRRAEPQPQPQPRTEVQRPSTVTRTVPVGTTLAVTLNQTLATDQNAPGDAFTARVSEPVLGLDGSVIIPAGATVRGRVTAVEKSDRIGETAVIKLAFESIAFGGGSYPLQASVVKAHPERRTRTSGREQAGKIAAGAAAGAVLGQVLGRNTGSTLKGAAIGAAAGTAIAMGTADVDAVLPAGSGMTLRVDSPVVITL